MALAAGETETGPAGGEETEGQKEKRGGGLYEEGESQAKRYPSQQHTRSDRLLIRSADEYPRARGARETGE